MSKYRFSGSENTNMTSVFNFDSIVVKAPGSTVPPADLNVRVTSVRRENDVMGVFWAGEHEFGIRF